MFDLGDAGAARSFAASLPRAALLGAAGGSGPGSGRRRSGRRQPQHAVHPRGELGVVGGDQRREAGRRARGRISIVEDPARGLGVEVAGRLVGEQQRAAGWRAPARRRRAAARRPRARPGGGRGGAPRPTRAQELARPRLGRGAAPRRRRAAAARRSPAPRTPAAGGGTGRRSRSLSRRSRVRARSPRPAVGLAEQPHLPRARHVEQPGDVQQRRLARAGGRDQRHDLARRRALRLAPLEHARPPPAVPGL